MTEEERMAAMFAVQNEQWSAAQNEMARYVLIFLFTDINLLTQYSQAPVFRPGAKKGQPNAHVPDHEPPAGYICYRCGEKGHWIQVCPTNDDPNFDNKPRVKRTTGIPRSFLKTVEKPVASANDGTEDDTKAPSGVMVNAEGEFVVAEPDKASWEQFQAKTKSSAAAEKAASSGNKELQERGLECSIDKRMFIDPMKTPCCEKTYCNDCITNALIESDFTCPNCQTDEVLIDNLKPDEEMNAKIKKYLEESKASQKPKSPSKSPTPQNVTTQQSVGSPQSKREGSLAPVSQEQHNSPSPQRSSAKPDQNRGANRATSEAPGPQTKKRPADVLLDDPKIPKAPRAMQQQQGPQQGQRQSQFHNNGMNNMSNPNMPFDMSQFGGNMFNPMMINGFGMPGMPMMGRNPNMMNPMMLPNGFPMQGGGYPPMNMQGMGMPYGPGGYGNNMNGGNGNFLGQRQNNGGAPAGNGQFANQQKNNFAGPTPAEEDNPYFRNPVNPHRHQGRQKRQRPSDYREL
jgi:protein MPE1